LLQNNLSFSLYFDESLYKYYYTAAKGSCKLLVQKAVKVQIYPRESDKELLAKHFGVRRFIFNKFLEIRQKEYLENKKSLGYNACSALLTEMKNKPEYEWLNEVNSQSIQAAIKDLDGAYDRFFRKLSKFPKFKSKHNTRQSFKVPQYAKVDWGAKTLKIPKFKTPFKFKGKYSGELMKINSVTISKNASGKYFASIQGEFEIEQKESTGEIIGVDLGIKTLLVDSNGTEIRNERFLRKHLKKLKYLQRQHSKKKKDSKSREKSRIKLAKEYQQVTDQRNNYLHQVSSKLINDNQVIVLEDLAVKNMLKNHKLAQAISDVSWGSLVSMLKYKAIWHNRKIVQIDRWYPSSKTCSNCNHLMNKMDLSIREWDCPSCSSHHDRDINAAKNILRQGLNIMSGLGTKSDTKQKRMEAPVQLAGSMKSENTRSLVVY
jgi:putative transposase